MSQEKKKEREMVVLKKRLQFKKLRGHERLKGIIRRIKCCPMQ